MKKFAIIFLFLITSLNAQLLNPNLLKLSGSELSPINQSWYYGNTVSLKSSSATISTEKTILGNASAGQITLTLPAASAYVNGILYFKKIDASTNTVIIDANGNELIDGSYTYVISSQYNSIAIQSNGTAWYVLYTSSPNTLMAYDEINNQGEQGFGVGICNPINLPTGLSPNTGCYDKASDNYGNYTVTLDGSQMVYVPAFVFKIVHDGTSNINMLYVKSMRFFNYDTTLARANGYVLHRAFIDGSTVKKGIFIDKYKYSLTNYTEGSAGVASSIKNSDPISSSSATKRNLTYSISGAAVVGSTVTVTATGHTFRNGNSVTITGVTGMTDLNSTFTISNVQTNKFDLTLSTAQSYSAGGSAKVSNYPGSFSDCKSNGQSPADLYGGIQAVAKSRGNDYFPISIFASDVLAKLSLAHGQGSVATTYNAWYDNTGAKNYPKGNNNSGADIDDATVTFSLTTDSYWTASEARKNGSGSNFAKTTHNGQNCGVADINGNQYEIASGLTALTSTLSVSGAVATDSDTKTQITTSASHGLSINDFVMITSVGGITSLNDKMWKVSDIIDATNFKVANATAQTFTTGGTITKGTMYVAKENVVMKNVTGGNSVTTSDLYNSTFLTNNFYAITSANLPFINGVLAQKYGNTTGQVLPFSLTRTADNYLLSVCGLPKSTGVSASGTNQFGVDYFYQYWRNELAPLRFGNWNAGSFAGAWNLALTSSRTGSYNYVSGRSCLYPTM